MKILMKKEMSQKVIEEVQEPAKEADKKSVSEAVREGNLFSDDDEFVWWFIYCCWEFLSMIC